MKINVTDNLNPVEIIRRAGYGQVMDRRATEQSWSRRLGGGIYPRFHIYINGSVINLHLDQKQASYEGSSAHSGEYNGEAVETEGYRIFEVMKGILAEKANQQTAVNSPIQPEKKGFFSRFFSG